MSVKYIVKFNNNSKISESFRIIEKSLEENKPVAAYTQLKLLKDYLYTEYGETIND